jgi:hypothetical protein
LWQPDFEMASDAADFARAREKILINVAGAAGLKAKKFSGEVAESGARNECRERFELGIDLEFRLEARKRKIRDVG